MRFQVKHVLIGVLVVLAAAIATQGGVALLQLRGLNANVLVLTQDWLPSVRGLSDLRYRTTRLRLIDARYVTALEPVADLDKVSAERL